MTQPNHVTTGLAEAAPARRGAAFGRAPVRGGGGARGQALAHLRGHGVHEGRAGGHDDDTMEEWVGGLNAVRLNGGPPPHKSIGMHALCPLHGSSYAPTPENIHSTTTHCTPFALVARLKIPPKIYPIGAAGVGGDGLYVRLGGPGLPPFDAPAAQVQGPQAWEAQGACVESVMGR